MAEDEGSGWGSRPSTVLEERQRTVRLLFPLASACLIDVVLLAIL